MRAVIFRSIWRFERGTRFAIPPFITPRKPFLGLLTLVGLAAAASGCFSPEDDTEAGAGAATSGQRPRILLFGAGGWNRCSGGGSSQSRIAANMNNLASQLKGFADVSVITECLRALPPSKPAAQTEVDINGQVGRVPARDIPGFVDEAIRAFQPSQIYTIGHSYGGWTVIDLLESGQLSRKVDATFALDPIDANDCLITVNHEYFVTHRDL